MAEKKKQDQLQKEMYEILGHMKDNMKKLGDEAKIWAKRGEKELNRLSQMGKLEIDIDDMLHHETGQDRSGRVTLPGLIVGEAENHRLAMRHEP